MNQTETKIVVNQTLLIWCGVVIIELFIIAQLMQSPLVIFAGFILFWPIKAAMNWPLEVPAETKTQ